MDLLGSYGSDDDASSVSSKEKKPSATSTSRASPSSTTTGRRRVVGKRIVSLHAVLPSEIRDRLTKGDDDNSSSDDSSVGNNKDNKTEQRTAVTKQNKQDDGLSLFLSELQSTNPVTNTMIGTTDFSRKEKQQQQTTTPIGLSLVSASTTSTKKGKDDDVVEDIHASTPIQHEEKVATVPQQSDAVVSRKEAPSPASRATAIPLSRPRFNVAPSAPQVPASTPASSISASHRHQQHQYSKSAPVPHQKEWTDNTSGVAPLMTKKSKKQSRQELEKALRSGQLDAVEQHFNDGNNDTVSIQAQDHTGYVAPQPQQQYQSHGISKAAVVKMYNPSLGGDELQPTVTSKHRSKHQINQLMANAVDLEAQRSQRAGMPHIIQKTSSGHRANAKRKYGW